MDDRVNPLMCRKVVGVVFFGLVAMVAVVTSLKTAGCGVVYNSCSCSCSVVGLHLWCSAISVISVVAIVYLWWCNECRAMNVG